MCAADARRSGRTSNRILEHTSTRLRPACRPGRYHEAVRHPRIRVCTKRERGTPRPQTAKAESRDRGTARCRGRRTSKPSGTGAASGDRTEFRSKGHRSGDGAGTVPTGAGNAPETVDDFAARTLGALRPLRSQLAPVGHVASIPLQLRARAAGHWVTAGASGAQSRQGRRGRRTGLRRPTSMQARGWAPGAGSPV